MEKRNEHLLRNINTQISQLNNESFRSYFTEEKQRITADYRHLRNKKIEWNKIKDDWCNLSAIVFDLGFIGLKELPRCNPNDPMTKTEALRLDGNNLSDSDIPNLHLDQFKKLDFITLEKNNLTKIPKVIKTFKDTLLTLYMSENEITKVPAWLRHMKNLGGLCLYANPINEIEEDIFDEMESLDYLGLHASVPLPKSAIRIMREFDHY